MARKKSTKPQTLAQFIRQHSKMLILRADSGNPLIELPPFKDAKPYQFDNGEAWPNNYLSDTKDHGVNLMAEILFSTKEELLARGVPDYTLNGIAWNLEMIGLKIGMGAHFEGIEPLKDIQAPIKVCPYARQHFVFYKMTELHHDKGFQEIIHLPFDQVSLPDYADLDDDDDGPSAPSHHFRELEEYGYKTLLDVIRTDQDEMEERINLALAARTITMNDEKRQKEHIDAFDLLSKAKHDLFYLGLKIDMRGSFLNEFDKISEERQVRAKERECARLLYSLSL